MSDDESLIVVSISGGKDSTATALKALDFAGPARVRLVHADTDNEEEITRRHIREVLPAALGVPIDIVRGDFREQIARKRVYVAEKWPEKGVPVEIVERALSVLHPTGNAFLDLCLWKGRFPSRRAQFCTQELKRYPLDAYMLDLMAAGHRLESWQGVRRAESQARRHVLAREETPEGWTIVRPIVEWTAQQVIDFVVGRGVPLNELYSLGCSRVGCMLCINASKNEIANAEARWPEHIDKIREWERLVSMASKRGWTTFFTDAAFTAPGPKPGWLAREVTAEDGTQRTEWVEPPAEIFARLNIDARVEWAKTSRGGVQYDMERIMPPDACSSIYGLCE